MDRMERWGSEFQKAAAADQLSLCRDHLRRLGLSVEPELLLKGTLLVVPTCCAYASIDGRSSDGFLNLQKYRPADAPKAKYAFTFDLFGAAFGRVLAEDINYGFDMADLNENPWFDLKCSGYHRFWVSRTDGQGLTDEEQKLLEEKITNDLRFDYSEDELDVWFSDGEIKGILEVNVQDLE